MSNMPDEEIKATLQMLVPMIIETICKQYGMDEYSALHSLYTSRLYSDLERERTKLWHLSPLALAELWHQEITTSFGYCVQDIDKFIEKHSV